MKRDMELVREILLKIESEIGADNFARWYKGKLGELDKYDFDCVYAHVRMLMEIGYINHRQQALGPGQVSVGDLSWHGHDFLDSVRDDEIWRQTKDVAQKAGGFTVDLLKQIAVGLIKTQLKKHTGVDI
ncbi:DUF2513 domain-containing protein [Glycocaulis sp.]|uniref:DUF2513 domain-containing protein n=1 Tax=Glycocaulis sp. TaxID=1969725 RepID=UPI003D1BB258